MSRLNLNFDEKTENKLGELLEWLNAASKTEVLRRAVEDAHKRESNRRKFRSDKPKSAI
jgi:hypothetical protein